MSISLTKTQCNCSTTYVRRDPGAREDADGNMESFGEGAGISGFSPEGPRTQTRGISGPDTINGNI